MGRAAVLSPFVGGGKPFLFPSVTQINLFSMKQRLLSSKVLDSLSALSPEPLSQDGEAWEEKEAHWAF